MSTPHANTGAVGIPGLQTGEDVNLSSRGKLVYDPSIWLHEHEQAPALQAAGV